VNQLWHLAGSVATGLKLFSVVVVVVILVAIFGGERYGPRAERVLIILKCKRKNLTPPAPPDRDLPQQRGRHRPAVGDLDATPTADVVHERPPAPGG
jgi:hypothetical protein